MPSRLVPIYLLLVAAACSSKPTQVVPDTRIYFDAPPGTADADYPDAQTAAGCDFVQRDPHNETIPWDFTSAFTICGTLMGATNTTYVIGSMTRQGVKATLVADSSLDVFQGGVTVDGGVDVQGHDGVSFVNDSMTRSAIVWFDPPGGSIDVRATNPTGSTAPINYKLTLAPYDFSTLCPQLSTPVEYTESHDGADSTGNDVFGLIPLALTGSTADAPEMTGLTITSGSGHRVDGTSAKIAQQADHGNDRDTYQIATGPDTTYLVVRATPFVDPKLQAFVIYNLVTPTLGMLETNGDVNYGPILLQGLGILPVQPSTTYWLQVEGTTFSTTNDGLPIAYDLSLCGLNTPP